jgi:hypothetical protein
MKPDGQGGMMCNLAGLQNTQLASIVRNLNMNNPGIAKKIISSMTRPEISKQVMIRNILFNIVGHFHGSFAEWINIIGRN